MKIKYEFVTGEVIEIEVSDDWEGVIVSLDKAQNRNDHKETRRHRTLSVQGDQGAWLTDEKKRIILECSGHKICPDDDRFAKAYAALSNKQKALYEIVYVRGCSLKEYAEQVGVSPAAATKLNKNVIKKFEKYFKKG